MVSALGSRGKLPVEVVPFGLALCRSRLTQLGCEPVLRTASDGSAYLTDNGNSILDCKIGTIDAPAEFETAILAIPGVLGTGLFIGMANAVIVERDGSAEVLRRE